MEIVTDEELSCVKGGEAITLSAIMAILSIAVVAVIAYRLFLSGKGSATMPGGFKFTWD